MQAVQDLSVEDRVSRTQFQYSLEAADPERAGHLGAAVRGQAANSAAICGTSPPTNKITPSKKTWSSIATPLRGWA